MDEFVCQICKDEKCLGYINEIFYHPHDDKESE